MMAAAIVMHYILKTLLSRRDSKPRCRSHHEETTEPFPSFDLPDQVIDKILKEYTSVKDKVENLSELAEFPQLLACKSLWYPSMQCSYEHLSKIKPGWYLFSLDLWWLRYYDVDYYNLKVTVFHFMILVKNSRIPIDMKTYKLNWRLSSVDLSAFQKVQIWVNEMSVYEYNSFSLSSPIYFWIFQMKILSDGRKMHCLMHVVECIYWFTIIVTFLTKMCIPTT